MRYIEKKQLTIGPEGKEAVWQSSSEQRRRVKLKDVWRTLKTIVICLYPTTSIYLQLQQQKNNILIPFCVETFCYMILYFFMKKHIYILLFKDKNKEQQLPALKWGVCSWMAYPVDVTLLASVPS